MKNTTLINLLHYWDELSYKEKINLLQRFEEENSAIQKRMPRELIINPNMEDNVGGMFSYDNPDVIFFPNPESHNCLINVNSIIHEGYHAYIFDHLTDKCDLTLYGNLNTLDFYKEKRYDRRLHKMCSHNDEDDLLFNLFSMEENLVRKETSLHFIYNLIKSCEKIEDLIHIAPFYIPFMFDEADTEIAKSQANEGKYVIMRAICESVFRKNIDRFYTTKKINTNTDIKLVNQFEKNLKYFIQIAKNPQSVNEYSFSVNAGDSLLDLYNELSK